MGQGFRFSLQVGAAAALTVTVTGVLLCWRVHEEASNAFRSESAAVARALAPRFSLSQDPIDPQMRERNERILGEAIEICPRLKHLSLIDKYGKVEVQMSLDGPEAEDPIDQWSEDLTLQEVWANNETYVFPGRWEGYYALESSDGTYWGKLRILWAHGYVTRLVNGLLVLTFLTALAVLPTGLLVGGLLYRTTLSSRVAEMADRLRHIINSGFRGCVNTAALQTELADLGDQVNRVLESLSQQRKRVVILEDSLRQTENSYHELQARSTLQTETSEREHEMALYAFQQLFENISDGAVLTDSSASVLALNGVAERWMHLLGQEGKKLSDDVLVRLIGRVVEQKNLDRDTSAWRVPDPLRGGRTEGRATAVVIRREESGVVYVLLLLRSEDVPSRRDWLAPLSERFLFQELLPWLSQILSERDRFPDVQGTWNLIDRHVDVLARLSSLRQIGATGPQDFHSLALGPWLSRHFHAADLFSRMISVRFHSPRKDCPVWTVESVLTQALDLLTEILLDMAEAEENREPIDLYLDSPPSGGVVLRFELGFEPSPSSRTVLKAMGDDQMERLARLEEAEQYAWSLIQHVKIVGVALLRSLLGCRLDMRSGEKEGLCVRWSFPPGGDHGSVGRAPNSSGSTVRINRLIRNYLTRSWETAKRDSSALKQPSVNMSDNRG